MECASSLDVLKLRKLVDARKYDRGVELPLGVVAMCAIELDWSGVLRVPLGALQPGATMRASFAVFLTFRDGKIASQHNYDCFEPF